MLFRYIGLWFYEIFVWYNHPIIVYDHTAKVKDRLYLKFTHPPASLTTKASLHCAN